MGIEIEKPVTPVTLVTISGSAFRRAASERREIVRMIKELQPEASQRAIAAVVGVDHATVHHDLRAGENSPPDDSESAPIESITEPAGENSPDELEPEREPDPQAWFQDAELDPAELAEREHDRKPGGRHGNLKGEYEWYTPGDVLEAARLVLGAIDLDPASCEGANVLVKAERFYTEEDDGLALNGAPWRRRCGFGGRVPSARRPLGASR